MNKINWIQVEKTCDQFGISEDEYFEIRLLEAEEKIKK